MTPPGPHAMTAQAGAVGWPLGVLSRDKTLEVLTYHNRWRRGAPGEQTDPRMLGLALDAVIVALATPPAAVPVEALEGLVAKLLNESESNFRRQFGDSNSAGWVYTDLRELFADELTQLIKERSNG